MRFLNKEYKMFHENDARVKNHVKQQTHVIFTN